MRTPTERVNASTTRFQIDQASYWYNEFYPRRFDVSPDGTRIVFANQGVGNRGLSMWDKATKITRKLDVPESERWRFLFPRWSPDGQRIALTAKRLEPVGAENAVTFNALFVFDPDERKLTQLAGEWEGIEDHNRVCWGPAAGELTLVRGAQAYRVTLDGRVNRWENFNVPHLGHLGGYSPDGQWLAFDARKDPGAGRLERDVWVMPSAGGSARQLTFEPGLDGYPCWASDGRAIYYVAADDDRDVVSWNLWRLGIDPQTGMRQDEPERVTFSKFQQVFHPKVVAGESTIVFVGSRSLSTIWIGEDGTPSRGKPAVVGARPVPSPNGHTIYYQG